jgi:large repetitive protein
MSSAQMPTANGSFFFVLNDGSGNTADVEDCVVAATNDAASGYFRLGVGNVVGANATTAQMFPLDLLPDQTYFVITALSLNNGQSAIWVSPTNQISMSVTDTTAATTYSIADVELRESGVNQGTISLGSLLVGKTFNSVFYPPAANPATFSVAENSVGNLLNPLAIDGGSGLTLANVSETDGNGTASISGTEVSFTPTQNFLGTATINYTLMDDMGNTASSTISVSVSSAVTPIPLTVSVASGHPVITWTNASFNLQSATNVFGPWTTISGATSPYSISTTNPAGFFRLVH